MLNILELNEIAMQLINNQTVVAKVGLPSTQQEIEDIIANDSIPKADSKVSFLPLHRLNSKKEKEICLAIIREVIESGNFTSGPYVEKIELLLCNMFSAKTCIATSSGTDALKIALKSIGVSHDDEVIIPPNSFAATENAIFAVGASPVYANIDKSFNLDPNDIYRCITHKTKAIMPVCLYGSAKNMQKIYRTAMENGLRTIVDAAQCFGIPEIINYADLIAFSFNPFKNIGTFGKSGALLTRSEKIGNIARKYSYHGFFEGKKNYKALDWGFNSRMDNMQAAVLFKKLEFFELNALKRCYLAHRYIKILAPLMEAGEIVLPVEKLANSWHLFPALISQCHVEKLMDFAKKRNIEFEKYYPLLSHENITPYSSSYLDKDKLATSSEIHKKLIHIPLHNHMTLNEQDQIIEVLYEYFKQ